MDKNVLNKYMEVAAISAVSSLIALYAKDLVHENKFENMIANQKEFYSYVKEELKNEEQDRKDADNRILATQGKIADWILSHEKESRK